MIDFSPAPQAAPRARQVWTHALTETRLIARNGEQVLLALVIPVALLIGGRFFSARLSLDFASVVPSVFALAIWSTCFTSLAIMTGFERRYGVLERLNATSLGRGGLLAGKALAVALITIGQLLVLAGVALALGWRPEGVVWLAIPGVPLAMLAFAACALALAGTLRAEAVLGLANLIYLAGMAAGILVPLGTWPETLRPVVSTLPTMALGELLRGTGGWWSLLVLAGWVVGAGALARKVFRWTS